MTRSDKPDPRIRRQFVSCDEGQIHVRWREGVGTPLVLFHASPGSSKMLMPLMERLETTRPLFALDTLGNGDSEPITSDEPDIAQFATAARQGLDALGIERFAIYGTHTGAHIGVELALTCRDRVDALIIDGMGLYSPQEALTFPDKYVPPVRPSDDGSQFGWVWHFVRNGYLYFPWFSRDAKHRTNADLPPVEFLHDKAVEVLKALTTYRESYLAAFRYPKREKLAQLDVPTLVTCGRQDVLIQYFEELVAAVPDATGALITSESFEDHFAALARRIDHFLLDITD